VSEMASSVCYDAFANIPERLAKRRSIVVVTSVCGYYNRHDCKSESTNDYVFARLQTFPKMNATYRYSIFVIVGIKLIAALGHVSCICILVLYLIIQIIRELIKKINKKVMQKIIYDYNVKRFINVSDCTR